MLPRCRGVGITVRTEAQVGSLAVYYQVILGLPSPAHCAPVLGREAPPSCFGGRLSKRRGIACHSQIAKLNFEYLIWTGRTRSRGKRIGSITFATPSTFHRGSSAACSSSGTHSSR